MKHPFQVAITIRSFDTRGPAYKKLQEYCTVAYLNTSGKRLQEAELVRALSVCEGVIAGTEKISATVFNHSHSLRIISRVGVGTDSIDLKSAEAHGVRIATTPNSPVQAVAEHTLALLLAAMKNIPQYNEQVRKNNHELTNGLLLTGKTVGIAGMGRIGSRVAVMLEALGCSIAFFDPFWSREIPVTWMRYDSLAELAGHADILILHAAPLPDGSPLVTREVLSHARGIILVNTARGSLVDEDALAEALANGTVRSAALDVFRTEPYTGKLLGFPQVVVTPHIASNTAESRSQMEMEAVDNLIQYIMEINA